MTALDLLPRPWRRAVIDRVYGGEDERDLNIYRGAVLGGFLLLTLLLAGCTPWAWPAEREGRVESMAAVQCEAIRPTGDDADSASETSAAANKARAKSSASGAPRSTRASCRQSLGDAARAQLGRTEELVTYLQRGGAEPPPLGVPTGTRLRGWIDANVCRLGGAGIGDRGALAWHVWRGAGECGAGSRLLAQLPLSILLSPWVGAVLTPLILLFLGYRLLRHALRLPATRRAYRLLYGSEHKAP